MYTIAVLFHEFERNPAQYIVHQLAAFWREAGHEVKYLFGTRRFEPADVLLVHVNLSVVPEPYLEFAARYPQALNRDLSDVRKSRISRSLLRPDDNWSGPAIVKSDLNYAGLPERLIGATWLEQRWSVARRIRAAFERRFPGNTPFSSSSEYRVFASAGEIPAAWYSARNVVVEKFQPEMEGDLYHLRIHQALGSRCTCTRLASRYPVVKAGNSLSAVDIKPHAEVAQWRRDLRLDYGKIDYVVVDGEPILLDVNKTTGANVGYRDSSELQARRRHLAEGIYDFLR